VLAPPARRLARASAVAAVPLLMIGLVGCQSTSTPPITGAVPSTTTSPGSTQTAPSALVARVGLVDADLTGGDKVRLYQAGDQVAGQVTMDNCGYHFASEAHRVARRQVGIVPVQGARVGYSNEVVAYDSARQAATALTELRRSVATCPKHKFENSTVAGVPDLRYDVSRMRAAPELPVKDSVVVTLVLSAKGSSMRMFSTAIFQRSGTVLNGMYMQTVSKPTRAETSTVWSLAKITGKRLAAL
jgi:hypothetical protein